MPKDGRYKVGFTLYPKCVYCKVKMVPGVGGRGLCKRDFAAYIHRDERRKRYQALLTMLDEIELVALESTRK